MRNEILTPRDLFDNVDYYRTMRMSFDRNGGGNVWRYKHAENSIHVLSNMVAQKYKNGTAVGMDWVADGTSDSRIDRLVEEYCDVVEALGTFAIAYGITDEDIRKGMGECEKRFRDGDAGGRKTVEENTIIDGLAELSTRLKEAQSRKHKKAPTKLSELEK